MATLKEIAEAAQVSYATVSHVLNGRTHKMAPETLARIQRILKEKNYVPNMTGRALAKHGSKIISIIRFYPRREIQNITTDPFFTELLGAMEKEIRRRAYYVMLHVAAEVEENIRNTQSWKSEGVIVTGPTPAESRQFAELTDVPLVFIDGYLENPDYHYANVGTEDRQGGYLMARYLLEQGHRNIAFVSEKATPLWGNEKQRSLGCGDAFTEKGLEWTEKNNCITISYVPEERHTQLWELAQSRRFTALFFVSDYLAADTICFYTDRGIRVPEDISICGFDDNQYAGLVRPKLTTIKQDVSAKGIQGVELLFSLIDKKETVPRSLILPVSLSIRDSAGKG
ncbi:LacI family DNA-binding transcriptional regulator [Breznakiellaceae bacterium SP9]